MINDEEHSFGDNQGLDKRMSDLVNEFCHVFRYHADGNWKSAYKPGHVEKMAIEISSRPPFIRKLLVQKDPMVSNVTYPMVELNKQNANESDSS